LVSLLDPLAAAAAQVGFWFSFVDDIAEVLDHQGPFEGCWQRGCLLHVVAFG
jgi:hypothetical protein